MGRDGEAKQRGRTGRRIPLELFSSEGVARALPFQDRCKDGPKSLEGPRRLDGALECRLLSRGRGCACVGRGTAAGAGRCQARKGAGEVEAAISRGALAPGTAGTSNGDGPDSVWWLCSLAVSQVRGRRGGKRKRRGGGLGNDRQAKASWTSHLAHLASTRSRIATTGKPAAEPPSPLRAAEEGEEPLRSSCHRSDGQRPRHGTTDDPPAAATLGPPPDPSAAGAAGSQIPEEVTVPAAAAVVKASSGPAAPGPAGLNPRRATTYRVAGLYVIGGREFRPRSEQIEQLKSDETAHAFRSFVPASRGWDRYGRRRRGTGCV